MPLAVTDWLRGKSRHAHAEERPRLRRLFVDVSTIVRHDAQTGIQRVVRSICRELASRGSADVAVYAVAASKWRPYAIVSTNLLPGSNDLRPALQPKLGPGDAFLGLDLSAHLFARHERQLRRWRDAGADIAVIVYDLLPSMRPDWFNPKTTHYFRLWLDVVARRASVVLPISRSVREDFTAFVSRHHPGRAAQIETHVLPLSGDIGLFGPEADGNANPVILAMRARHALLMVGTVEPRKGHSAALAAHRRAWSDNPSEAPLLVIAGRPGWQTEELQEELRQLDLERDGAIWLEEVCDTLLDRLYRDCRGLLVASLGEGYCLPIKEAFAYGKPVLARNLPVLRELDSPSITYFDDDRPDQLAKAMIEFAANPPASVDQPDAQGWADSVGVIMRALRAESSTDGSRCAS